MYTLLLLAAFAALTVWYFYRDQNDVPIERLPLRITDKLDRLWQIAQEGLRDRKYLRAEKALLTILRVDERYAAAYNRLGILYARQRAFNDAIECFEIAQSLEPSASNLHNVGLIYYETAQYEKAAIAFEQAIDLESNLSARYIAYAKVQEKMGDNKKMVAALEKAVELEPNTQALRILADAYERIGDLDLAAGIKKKLEKIMGAGEIQRTIRQPRKVVM